jgi:hypothetical protein
MWQLPWKYSNNGGMSKCYTVDIQLLRVMEVDQYIVINEVNKVKQWKMDQNKVKVVY